MKLFKAALELFILLSIKTLVAEFQFSERKVTCSAWPDSSNYGCTNVGANWIALNKDMNSSHTQDCQNLCMERKEDGCCYLNDQFGCYWKEKEDVSPLDAGTGMAVRCSVSGKEVEPFYN